MIVDAHDFGLRPVIFKITAVSTHFSDFTYKDTRATKTLQVDSTIWFLSRDDFCFILMLPLALLLFVSLRFYDFISLHFYFYLLTLLLFRSIFRSFFIAVPFHFYFLFLVRFSLNVFIAFSSPFTFSFDFSFILHPAFLPFYFFISRFDFLSSRD